MWGPLPDELFDLSHSLKELFIAYNRFSGTIPTAIGTMEKLTDFYAYGNELSGSLPSEIGKMKKLENLVLADNRLTGQIPEEVSSMPSLQLFSISNKDENTPGLTGTLPTFKHAPQLTDLYLYGNSISGPIPQDFLSSSNNIFLVILSHNKVRMLPLNSIEGGVFETVSYSLILDVIFLGKTKCRFLGLFRRNWLMGSHPFRWSWKGMR